MKKVFTPSILISLLILTTAIITANLNLHKTNTYPYYVKTTIVWAFMISLIPTTMFIQSGQEWDPG